MRAVAVGDNRNMLSLIALRDTNNLKSGTQSVYDIYNNAVSQVAVDTRSAKANAETEESLLNSVKDQRASITGVNLEEERQTLFAISKPTKRRHRSLLPRTICSTPY